MKDKKLLSKSGENTLKIEECNISFSSSLAKSYAPQQYLEEIRQANLLIIPEETFRGKEVITFPELTEEFLNYAKQYAEENQPDMRVDILADDNSFQKLGLHSFTIYVAPFIVTNVLLPAAINMVTSFLYDKVKSYRRKPEDLTAKVDIIVEDGEGSNQRITYVGPVEGIHEVLNSSVVRNITKKKK